jgi:uncharacterized protein YhfF
MSDLTTKPANPREADLLNFWQTAKAAIPDAGLGNDYQVRWIGLDDQTTTQVLELIGMGDKTGTFTLPWIVEQSGDPMPQVGDAIILISFNGMPKTLLRLTQIEMVAFGDVTEAHTAVDGSPVRALEVWIPLHTAYWNELLRPFGLSVCDEMPVLVEKFEVLYEALSSDA